MKKVLVLFTLLLPVLGLYAQHQVQGNVCYINSTMTYLDSVTVYLKQDTVLIDQTTTDGYGHFIFNNVADGDYTLSASCTKIWGGCNSSDATSILKHFVMISRLSGLRKLAANVDKSSTVNPTDALLVSKRFVHLINYFPAGDWVIEQKSIIVSGASVRQDLKATCYGDVNGSFSPAAEFICGQSLTDTRDDQTYPTVLIGEQCWMAKNMNIGTFISGVGDQTDNYVIEKFCYHNVASNCTDYGGLYQWGEMMQYDTTPGGQGICPSGWHIPTNVEWDTLVYRVGGYAVGGAALKVGGGSGFEALLAGWVFNCQKFRQMGIQGFFWTSNQNSALYGYSRILTWNTSDVVITFENIGDGLSVRCLKD